MIDSVPKGNWRIERLGLGAGLARGVDNVAGELADVWAVVLMAHPHFTLSTATQETPVRRPSADGSGLDLGANCLDVQSVTGTEDHRLPAIDHVFLGWEAATRNGAPKLQVLAAADGFINHRNLRLYRGSEAG